MCICVRIHVCMYVCEARDDQVLLPWLLPLRVSMTARNQESLIRINSSGVL